jgi:hypothetical protein
MHKIVVTFHLSNRDQSKISKGYNLGYCIRFENPLLAAISSRSPPNNILQNNTRDLVFDTMHSV